MEETPLPEDAAAGYDLEEVSGLEPVVHAVCPLCHGTRMTAGGICLRCGVQPAADEPAAARGERAEDEAEPEDFDDGAEPPMAAAQMWDRWFTVLLAGAAGCILLVGILSGAKGLFPLHHEPDTAVPWMPRLAAAFRLPFFALGWTCCALAALATAAWIEGRPMGSVPVAIRRFLAIILVAHLITFLALPWRGVAFTIELFGQATIFWALTIVLFRLSAILAGRVVLLTLTYGVALIVLTRVIAWSLSA